MTLWMAAGASVLAAALLAGEDDPAGPVRAPADAKTPIAGRATEKGAPTLEDLARRLEAAESVLSGAAALAPQLPGAEMNAPSSAPAAPGAAKPKSDTTLLESRWEPGVGLIFQTPKKDFKIHVGGRFQAESLLWNQPRDLTGPAPGNGGLPAANPGDGVGSLDDGFLFRRVRLRADGTAYDKMEFALEVDFEQLNFITYDHLWFGWKDLPYLGTVRIGQHKVPQGMEMLGSDYHLDLLERSSLSDAIWTLFAPGIFIANNYAEQHVSTQAMFHRIQPTGFFTSDFGDGDYAATTRATALLWYECEGAELLHLGGSYQWRHGDLGRTIQPGGTGSAFGDTQEVVRFRARPELRDATGVGTTLGGDPGRFIDTGFLLIDNVHTVSPELLWISGPFSIQSEAAFAFAENVRQLYPAAAQGTPHGTAMFWGGYVEGSWILTGEHRGYDKRFGTYDRIKVAHPFSLYKDDQGCTEHGGCGAWQVAYRYSYIDLNDAGIFGGALDQHTFGLNWYFNENAKIQFQYSRIHRGAPGPAVSGFVDGFGVLAQWYF
jgi:phosphate-selective porin OprO/OprP